MAAFLSNLTNTVVAGVVLLVILVIAVGLGGISYPGFDADWWAFFFRWLHVLSGVMWIGLLWYFNFVQVPGMPKIPDDQKPAINKVIAPSALWWFRWGAMATIVTGLILAWLSPTAGGIGNALALGITNGGASTPIGVGMWMGIIMWFNVWFLIWPNQKKVLGMVEASDEEKAKAKATAGMFSRINTLLSIPMLYCMVAQQNGGFS